MSRTCPGCIMRECLQQPSSGTWFRSTQHLLCLWLVTATGGLAMRVYKHYRGTACMLQINLIQEAKILGKCTVLKLGTPAWGSQENHSNGRSFQDAGQDVGLRCFCRCPRRDAGKSPAELPCAAEVPLGCGKWQPHQVPGDTLPCNMQTALISASSSMH